MASYRRPWHLYRVAGGVEGFADQYDVKLDGVGCTFTDGTYMVQTTILDPTDALVLAGALGLVRVSPELWAGSVPLPGVETDGCDLVVTIDCPEGAIVSG